MMLACFLLGARPFSPFHLLINVPLNRNLDKIPNRLLRVLTYQNLHEMGKKCLVWPSPNFIKNEINVKLCSLGHKKLIIKNIGKNFP